MKFGIYSNRNRDIGYEVALKTARIIIDKGATPVFDELHVQPSDFNDSNLEGIEFGSFKECNLIISIGGDGTFLGVISDYRDLNKPFIGINKGSIGFLTQASEDTMDDAISRILGGKYSIIERIQLYAELYDKDGNLKGSDICLNDVAVLRGDKPHIVRLSLYIDGKMEGFVYGSRISDDTFDLMIEKANSEIDRNIKRILSNFKEENIWVFGKKSLELKTKTMKN